MASYSSILRKDKPLNTLSRGLKKDNGLQSGVLIEKIYFDRNKGRKSSNIRLVDSSSAANTKNESENSITNSRNSDLSEKPESGNESVETRIPKMLQTLETTHTFVTNSAGSYYLQTKKETQSIIDDLEEFPALGTNKPTKRVADANQTSGLSPYAKPFVFTGAFEGNTIYNAYQYYRHNDGSDEYDAGIYDAEFYTDNPNENSEELWEETEWNGTEQVETSSPNAEYEITNNNDEPDYESIALSRKKYLSHLSVDAKPFEIKKNVANTDNSEQQTSEDSAVPSLRPSYRSISVESSPFVSRNSSQFNIRPENNLVDNSFKKKEEKNILTEDQIKRMSFRSQFHEQSRNFRFDREAVIQSCEDTKYASPVYKSPSARINPSKDIPTDSIDWHKNSERRGVNLSVESKSLNLNKTFQYNSVDGKEKNIQDDSYSRKKFPLMPLPSNVSKPTAPANTNLRPDAQPFKLPKSKLEKQIDNLENHYLYSSTYNRKNNSPTKSTSPTVNGSSSHRTFKASHSSTCNDYKQVQNGSKTPQNTNLRPDAQHFYISKSKVENHIDDLENYNPNSATYNRNNSPPKNIDSTVNASQCNRSFKPSQSFAYNACKQVQNSSEDIVSWRRGALSKLILNSSDDTSNRETTEAKKFNQVSPTNRHYYVPGESHSKRNNKLSLEAQSLKLPKEDETVENKDYNDPKTKSTFNNRSYIPYVQPWSNGSESPITSSNLNIPPRKISNSYSTNEDEDCNVGNSRYEKPVLHNANDSRNQIGVQYKDHFKRDTISNVVPEVGNEYTEHPKNSNQLSSSYSPNPSPELKEALPFHTLSHDLSDPYTKNQSPERQQNGFIQQWNNYNRYRYDQTAAIYQPQWPPASFPTPLNIRSVEQANSRLNMSPIHHQTPNNHINGFARHATENVPGNMNANFHPQTPGYDMHLWNPRQPYNGPHSDPMMAYRQSVNCTAPNSVINPAFPIPNRYIGPQIMPHNPMPIAYNRFPNEYKNEGLSPIPQFMSHNSMPIPHNLLTNFANEYRNENPNPTPQILNHNSMLIQHNLPNRFPNEYRNENQSPVKNTSSVETNLIVSNSANRTSPPWPTNCARDFNHFTDMYAQKLTSQMLPVIQAKHIVCAVTKNSQIDVNSSSNGSNNQDFLQDEQTTNSFPIHSQGFEDHAEVSNETSKSPEMNFIKITQAVGNPIKNVISALQKENPSLLIPPPIPPRRNINTNRTNRECLSTADKLTNSLTGNNPFKNNSSANHTSEETVLIRNKEAAKLLRAFPGTNINQNRSENRFSKSEEPSTTIELQNNNVSKNPFLNDFTAISSGETTKQIASIDLNPFRQQLTTPPSEKPRGKNPFLDVEIEDVDSCKVTSSSANHPIIDLPKDPLWYYRDPQNNIQGPFTSIEMAEWFHNGYFKDDVKIRRNCDKRYVGIGEFLKLTGSSSPFLESRLVPPLGIQATISRKSTNPFSNDWQSSLSLKSCELYDS